MNTAEPAPLVCLTGHPPQQMTVAEIYDPGEDDPEIIHAVWECGTCGARFRHDGPLGYEPERWAKDSTLRRPD